MSTAGTRQFQCYFCAHIYDEAQCDPASGIAPGTLWEDVPDDWYCPECGAGKADFALLETT